MIAAARSSRFVISVNDKAWNLTEGEAIELRNKLNGVLDSQKDHAIEVIKEICSEQFRVPVSAMEGPARPDEFCRPRHAAMWLSRQCGFGLAMIGKRMGGRDHGTVIHACSLVKDRMSVDRHWKALMEYLVRLVSERTGITIALKDA
jgi:chromosomal replication initiator protein